MSFLDRLLGTQKPVAAKMDGLFAMSTAVITLQTALHLEPANQAAICFKAIDAAGFDQLRADIDGLLKIRAAESGTNSQMHVMADEYGMQWVLLQTEQFEDLVTTIHMVSQQLKESGTGDYADRLLAAVFKFTGDGRNVYWMYNYKRGKFYPVVPRGNQQRDNVFELRLQTTMQRELPIEDDLERWYPMWGMPL